MLKYVKVESGVLQGSLGYDPRISVFDSLSAVFQTSEKFEILYI